MKSFIYLCMGFLLAVAFFSEDHESSPDVTRSDNESAHITPSTQISDNAQIAPATAVSLPSDSDKSTDFKALPKTAALQPQKPGELLPDTKLSPPKWLYVSGDRVNMRAGPSVSHTVLDVLERGTRLELLQRRENWIKVRTIGKSPDRFGWMSARYLSDRPLAPVARNNIQPKHKIAGPSARDIAQAKKQMIKQSIAGYRGSCPCPYNTDRAGRRCGRRSAWSRPGGASPLCYESDVSEARIDAYFVRRGGAVQ